MFEFFKVKVHLIVKNNEPEMWVGLHVPSLPLQMPPHPQPLQRKIIFCFSFALLFTACWYAIWFLNYIKSLFKQHNHV